MFSNFIPPWTLFSPTLDKIITRSIRYLPTVYIYFLGRSPFLRSDAGQFSNPLARDQVQSSENSHTKPTAVFFRGYTRRLFTSFVPLWPSVLVLSPLSPPLSSVHRCAPLASRTLARDSLTRSLIPLFPTHPALFSVGLARNYRNLRVAVVFF